MNPPQLPPHPVMMPIQSQTQVVVKRYRALYDYKARNGREMSFKKGEVGSAKKMGCPVCVCVCVRACLQGVCGCVHVRVGARSYGDGYEYRYVRGCACRRVRSVSEVTRSRYQNFRARSTSAATKPIISYISQHHPSCVFTGA